MLEFLKEALLAIFVVGYRINRGAWPASFNADAHKGVAAVVFVEMWIGFTIFGWAQILSGSHIELSTPALWFGAVALWGVSYYFLLVQKLGSGFEKHFDHLPKTRRVILRITALVIFFGALALFLISIPYYQHAFHITPKTR
jgi:hypothetical protein